MAHNYLKKFTVFAALVAVFSLVFTNAVLAALVPGSPASATGVVPWQGTAGGPSTDVPSNTDGNTCSKLASFNLEGWEGIDLTNAVGKKIDNSAGTVDGPLTTTTDGTYLSWTLAPGYKMLGFVMKGGNDANIYNYAPYNYANDQDLASPANSSGNPAGISHYNFCYVPTGIEPATFSISGRKFFDINANGVEDPGDFSLAGFTIRTIFAPDLPNPLTNPVLMTTGVDGTWSINGIPEGTNYLVREDVPTACDANNVPLAGFSWVQTAPDFIDVTAPFTPELGVQGYQGDINADVTGLDFGNRCEAPGSGGHTRGFWGNKNGQDLITAADIAALDAFNLRNANGSIFNPTSKTAYKNWLGSSNATNMAYMLSAQMSATYLNVAHGFIDSNALLDVGGQIGTINGWITEANTSLGSYGNTTEPHAQRANQERLKNIFDGVNNNNFVFINTSCTACSD